MIVELGHYSLVLALALALVQSVAPIWGARTADATLMGTAPALALAQGAFVAASFAALLYAYATSDFSVATVFENSHSQQPLVYKLSGAWGNHEGSMLLWALILALFGALVAAFGQDLRPTLKANVLGVQAWVASAFLLFILGTSNPFRRLLDPPIEGRDLNPILQDIGLAIHPPLLYLGYVGFSICFAFAVAALIEGRLDAAWARWVRPWALTAWVFLTLGIAMGSYWAYYELGWGGWWFWDPVENASFLPWLAGTALLHSALVMEKREALKVWTVLLAILAFSLSLLGTFLVRSGVLNSVHSFANDPARGVFILAILVLFIGGALALYAARAGTLAQGGLFAPISREGALVFNNLFLSTACAAVLVGTLYPLALEALTGAKISVGAPYFEATFVPLMVPLLAALPFGPLLAWKRGDLLGAAQRLFAAFGIAIVVTLAIYAFVRGGPALAPLGVGLAAYIVLGAGVDLAERIALFRTPFGVSFARARGLPRAAWGTALAHAGVGIALLGMVGESAWKTERVVQVHVGERVAIGAFTLTLQDLSTRAGPNFTEAVARFAVARGGRPVGTMEPAKRLYTARRMPTTEAALLTHGLVSQLYVAPGETLTNNAIDVRIYDKPLVLLIWLGCVAMAAGGTLSLSDRRLRVGAPRPAQPAVQPAQGAEAH